jgi:hypothetical protein
MNKQLKSKCLAFLLFSSVITIHCIGLSVPVLAQSSSSDTSDITKLPPENINLSITKVVKEGKDYATDQIASNSYSFKGVLNSGDGIKYTWDNTRIGVYFKTNPAICCGYLAVYLNDENKAENFLGDTGSDDYPYKLSKIADKLKAGKNTLIFVFFDHTNKATNNIARISFDYGSESPKPNLSVIKPGNDAVFSKDSTQNIVLDLDNFSLSKTPDGKNPQIGKLNVYGNDTNNLLGTIDSGSTTPDGKFRVDFKPETLTGFSKLPDKKDTKLIFQLVTPAESKPVAEATLNIITNFNKTADVGIPTIAITEPVKNSTNTVVNEDKVFYIDYQNFTVLNKAPIQSNAQPSNKEGFLQIFVDNVPMNTMWQKKDFTLREIGYTSTELGEKEVKVQLVNSNYEKLSPEAVDKIKIQYQPTTTKAQSATVESQNNNWKTIIIVLTVILIVGGILISITKS